MCAKISRLMIKPIYKSATCFWLLTLAITMRSLIAPGYMVDTESPDGFGWNIILCNGLNAVNAIDGMEQMHAEHAQHMAPHGDSNSTHDEHEEDHFSATCGLWSGSTTFIKDAEFDTSYLLSFRSENFGFNYTSQLPLQSIYNNRLARAPPA